MKRRSGYRTGDFYRIDDRTGFAVRASRTVKEWDNQIVDRHDVDGRHPQDFVRGRAERQSVPDPRPDPDPIFQAPEGGPFFLLTEGGNGEGKVIEIVDGEIYVYRGDDQPAASEL